MPEQEHASRNVLSSTCDSLITRPIACDYSDSTSYYPPQKKRTGIYRVFSFLFGRIPKPTDSSEHTRSTMQDKKYISADLPDRGSTSSVYLSTSIISQDGTNRSTRSVGSSSFQQKVKTFFSRFKKGTAAQKEGNYFLHDPEGQFSLTPYRSDLIKKLDSLVRSDTIQSHMPFYKSRSCPLSIPGPEQFLKAVGLLQHGLEMQEKGQHETAITNVMMAAELGVPLALYWLAISARYGWSQGQDPEASFSCFLFAAYLSLLACIHQEQNQKKADVSVPMMNESIKNFIMDTAKSSTFSYHRKPTHSRTESRNKNTDSLSSASDLAAKSGTLPSHRYHKSEAGTISPKRQLPADTPAPSKDFKLNLFDSHELAMILFEIGACYEYGLGTERDYAEAAYYYELAAGLGDPDAAQQVADCYLHGHGVSRDKWRAAAYYRMAEKRGITLVNSAWIHKEKWGGSLRKRASSKDR